MDKLEGEVNNLTSMVSKQQKMMKEIQGMLAAMHTRFDNLASNHSSENSHKHGEGERYSSRFNSGPFGSHSAVIPRVTKLDFPRFNGNEDPTSWIYRAEQFFEFQNIVEEKKISLAAYHLEGEAQLWYQILKEEERVITWPLLKEGLYTRYGPTEFDDFFGDLTKLKQMGSVRKYQSQFERLLSRVGKLPPTQQVGCFISGLKEHLRIDVQALKPTSLFAAVGLARLYEAKSQFQDQQPPSEENEGPLPPSLSKVSPTTKTFKKLTPTELKERRDKGLCFNCDEKFAPGHQCKKLFFIEVGWPDEYGEGSLEDKG